MKWIEIIELRSGESSRELLEMQLQRFISQLDKEAIRHTIKIYNRVTLETDISIHLYHESNKVEDSGSSLGIRLVSALNAHGLVNHTVWVEKPKYQNK
ncbi:hypothetical protein ACFL6O_04330 [candidate division KSB1 bacterium]